MGADGDDASMKRIHILRSGSFRDMNGTEVSFSATDLAATAAAYDPKLSESPLVVGHPKTDAPAYGWVASLSADADGLHATPHQVIPEFSDMVSAGNFKKISASLYPPTHPSNPKPGVWYLKHVGFIGAMPPAIKGLKQIELADDADCVTIELATYADAEATLVQRVFARFVAMFSEASTAVPTTGAGEAALAAFSIPTPLATKPAAETSETDTMTDEVNLAERQRDLDAREAKIKTDEQRIALAATRERREKVVAFVDGLVSAAKLLPRERAFCVELISALDPAKTVEFSEGGETKTLNLADGLQDMLKALPPRIELKEIAGGTGLPRVVAFAAPEGKQVDRAGLETHSKAMDYQREHKVEYLDAVRAVTGQ